MEWIVVAAVNSCTTGVNSGKKKSMVLDPVFSVLSLNQFLNFAL